MQFNSKVQEALRHVNSLFPQVTQVFFSANGMWRYCDDFFEAPSFIDAANPVDVGLLEDAVDAAANDAEFPCAYRLFTLSDYYALWDSLADIPVAEGESSEMEEGAIEQDFLHFRAGTPREDIWRWFESQHPEFVVGEVQQGIRRAD